LPAPEPSARRVDGDGNIGIVGPERQVRHELRCSARGETPEFASGDLFVAVGIKVEPCLERRDLCHVDDVMDRDCVARNLDPTEAIDREIPEGMRVRRPGSGNEERSRENQ
jgi:hypothetical protein